MSTFLKRASSIFFAVILITALSGCDATRNASSAQKGAVVGAAGGAILGGILGNNVGSGKNSALGAVLGGVVGGSAGAIIGNSMDKQAQKIEEEIPGAQVERIEDGIVITFDENSGVYFETNKYNLNDKSQETLNRLANVLVEYPDTHILVVGHTDSTGPRQFNMTLSRDRANSVTSFFVNQRGLSAGRITTESFGPDAPIADNGTVEGRAKNRRVNVAIVPNEKMKEDARKEAGE